VLNSDIVIIVIGFFMLLGVFSVGVLHIFFLDGKLTQEKFDKYFKYINLSLGILALLLWLGVVIKIFIKGD